MNPDAKILVVSDVHGRLRDLRWILLNETADAMFFLGDGLYDLDQALRACENAGKRPAYPIYRVRGNCDPGYLDPVEGLVPIAGVLFFYTHGHFYSVKSSHDVLAEAAADRGADVALFGHTHCHALVNAGLPGLPTLFNPGSVRDGASYGVITISDGDCQFGWKLVPQ